MRHCAGVGFSVRQQREMCGGSFVVRCGDCLFMLIQNCQFQVTDPHIDPCAALRSWCGGSIFHAGVGFSVGQQLFRQKRTCISFLL